MNNDELNRIVDLIWSTLNCVENEGKSRQEQRELLKPIILELSTTERTVGRGQVLNHIEHEIKGLR